MSNLSPKRMKWHFRDSRYKISREGCPWTPYVADLALSAIECPFQDSSPAACQSFRRPCIHYYLLLLLYNLFIHGKIYSSYKKDNKLILILYRIAFRSGAKKHLSDTECTTFRIVQIRLISRQCKIMEINSQIIEKLSKKIPLLYIRSISGSGSTLNSRSQCAE